MTTQASKRVSQAIRQACVAWPYAAKAILSMQVSPKPGIGTAAVDAKWRMVYDPAFVDETDDATLIFVVQHEVCHLILRHHRRSRLVLGAKPTKRKLQLWNIAGDIAIHCLFANEGIKYPDWVCTWRKYAVPANKSVEEYYTILSEREGDQDDLGDNDSDDGDPTGRAGGSAADGQQREWEDDLSDSPAKQASDGNAEGGESGEGQAEGEGSGEGISEGDEDSIIQQVAEAAAKACGKGKGGDSFRDIGDYLLPPKIRPETLLRKALTVASTEYQRGHGRQTYARRSRRQASSFSNCIRPTYRSVKPKVSVVVDTSRSMNKTALALGLGLIDGVIRSLGMEVSVVTGDTQIASDDLVRTAKQVDLRGGGGTDQGALITQVADKHKPDLILCVTDGWTPWPKQRTSMPVVVCLTEAETSSYAIPAWMHKVRLDSAE